VTIVSLTGIDLWAAAAAAIAACAVGLRRYMLKPGVGDWAPAPWPVQLALAVLAISLGMAAISIAAGGHATAREAMVYTVVAGSGVVMAWNLHANGRAAGSAHRHGAAGLVTTFESRDVLDARRIFERVQRREGGR
jgi:hypothetical protein